MEEYCEECCICYNTLHDKEKHIIWNCNHSFHKQCIIDWKKSCPVCRCDEKINSNLYNYTNKHFDIEYFLSWALKSTCKNNEYKKFWKETNCLNNNHEITFHKTYGIIGICHNCSIVQPLNYIN